MTLDAKLLKKLADWQPGNGRGQLTVEEAGWTITIAVDRRDEFSCLLWELSLTRKQSDEALRTWAERLEKSVSAVLEPIKVLEIDEQRHEAMLRSTFPHVQTENALHYELFLTGTKAATLRRYKSPANKSGKREQIAFALTNEGLLRLLGGLAS